MYLKNRLVEIGAYFWSNIIPLYAYETKVRKITGLLP